ncbi:hypothetical protein ABZ863_06010 [Saccharomonospora sp. NPDC046836]|uniref:hypothetical protein n=1 Tax=Saccharomonospora sp. NPDC046836 TaxID=3156921 RepID=UPI0033D7471F
MALSGNGMESPLDSHAVAALACPMSRLDDHLPELFAVLGVPWRGDLTERVELTRRLWLGPEHGQIIATYDDKRRSRALAVFDKIGMLTPTLPNHSSEFAETNIVCGTWAANENRLRRVLALRRQHGCQLGTINLWCGQRLRESRDGSADDIVERLRIRDAALTSHPWMLAQLRLDPADPDPWRRPFATEYEVAVAAALAVLGPRLGLVETRTVIGVPSLPTVPARTLLWQRFRTPDGQQLVALNAAAQPRLQGPPRHTTASCAQEWLRHLPPPRGAAVLLFSGNPHTARTLDDVRQIVGRHGRHDLAVHAAGSGAPESPRLLEMCLGEVARMLHNRLHDGLGQ